MSTLELPIPAAERPLLARISISTFAWVMGLGGLANAWFAAHQVFGVPLAVSQALLWPAVALFVLLLAVHAARAALHFDAVREEFMHPVRASFFPAASVAAIVLAIGLRPYCETAATALWCAGAALHMALAITLVRRWLLHPQEEGAMTPAWFIPVVGNILVPAGGVPLGFVQASWFFFSVGLVLWLVFFTIALHRILFFPTLGERSLPTVFILLAPPSIGLSAYFAFNHGVAGPLADILYCMALFIALLLATMLRELTHGKFFLSWWAMTFPLDGWAGASIFFHRARPSVATEVVALVALAAASAMCAWVAGRTALHVARGQAFRED